MVELRTIKQCYEQIKSQDQYSAITIYCIRKWCKEGFIRYVNSGTRLLIDYATLKEFIQTGKSFKEE